MSKVQPYHTDTPEGGQVGHRDVYHDHDNCSEGRRIKPKNRRPGTGGRPRCDECKSMG